MLISKIFADSGFNCRGPILLHQVSDLAESIKTSGQLQPVVVVAHAGPKPFKLIAGFRRFTAISQVLKWKEIEAKIVIATDDEAAFINLQENLQRSNLDPLMEARALDKVCPERLYSCRAAAAKVSRTTAWILCRRKLLTLPEDIQLMVAAGRIPLNRISAIANADDQASAVKSLLARGSVRQPSKDIRKRTLKEVRQLIIKLHENGLSGIATRSLAWVCGQITSQDIDADIEQCVREGKS